MAAPDVKTSSCRLIDGDLLDDQVIDLRKQLREKDMKLTDIRLEALSSAHQLEQVRETMNRMKVSAAAKHTLLV